jgi:predicted aminopeptidase
MVEARAGRVALACLSLSLSGCSLLELARGQLSLINDQVTLERAIAREPDPERRELLREVPAIVAFAEDVVGLHAGRSYRGYYEIERRGLTFVLTACKRTQFEAYAWWFPVVGKVEYRSYWDEDDAQVAARELEANGYDTWISPSRAYSSLGILRDPIATTMLHDGLLGLAEVVIHELSHAKLFVPGQTAWNEALASFVGERGAERYFSAARFAHSEFALRMKARAERRLALDREVDAAYTELDRLYGSDQTEAEKLGARERSFARVSDILRQVHPDDDPSSWRINNARLVHIHRYTANNGVLAELWEHSGQNFRRFWLQAERYAHEQF